MGSQFTYAKIRRSCVSNTRALVLLFLVSLFSCTNIDTFEHPHLVETFMGALSVTPAVEGLYASGLATGGVTVVGDKEGKMVTIYGLPTNTPFELLPKSQLNLIPPSVSGLVAEVVSKELIRIVDFASKGGDAVNWDLEVRGQMVRQGPRLSTHPEHPIVISVRAADLKASIKKSFLPSQQESIRRKTDDAMIEEVADNEIVDLYQVNFRGDATSVL